MVGFRVLVLCPWAYCKSDMVLRARYMSYSNLFARAIGGAWVYLWHARSSALGLYQGSSLVVAGSARAHYELTFYHFPSLSLYQFARAIVS